MNLTQAHTWELAHHTKLAIYIWPYMLCCTYCNGMTGLGSETESSRSGPHQWLLAPIATVLLGCTHLPAASSRLTAPVIILVSITGTRWVLPYLHTSSIFPVASAECAETRPYQMHPDAGDFFLSFLLSLFSRARLRFLSSAPLHFGPCLVTVLKIRPSYLKQHMQWGFPPAITREWKRKPLD